MNPADVYSFTEVFALVTCLSTVPPHSPYALTKTSNLKFLSLARQPNLSTSSQSLDDVLKDSVTRIRVAWYFMIRYVALGLTNGSRTGFIWLQGMRHWRTADRSGGLTGNGIALCGTMLTRLYLDA